MQKNYVESLLRMGVIEAKAGSRGSARRYLEGAIAHSNDPDLLADAWYWLSILAEEPSAQRAALESCLSYNFQHARARRDLAILDGKLDPQEIINPDSLSSKSEERQTANADRFVCPKCGGRMTFTPDGEQLVCEFCSRGQTLNSEKEAQEQDFIVAMATARGHQKPVAVQVFHCQGCGAEFILPAGVLSTVCAWCNSPHVISQDTKRDLVQPEGIIPHAFDRAQASRLLVNWVEQNGIKPQKKVEPPRGFYLPIWTFDIGGSIEYSGDRYEKDDNLFQQSQGIVHIQEEYPVHINDLPVPASQKLDKNLVPILHTFDLSLVRPYDPRYLSGWTAEVYDVPMANASLDARSQAFSLFKHDLPGRITSLFNLKISSAGLAIESFKLVLLPAWITEIPTGEKPLLLLINGQNGIIQIDPSAKPKSGLFGFLSAQKGQGYLQD